MTDRSIIVSDRVYTPSIWMVKFIATDHENCPILAVFFSWGYVLLLAGRQHACVVGFAPRKKSSQGSGHFSCFTLIA